MEHRTTTFDDTVARQLIAEGKIDRAMAMIDSGLRLPVCAWLRRKYPTLSAEDLVDTWSATVHGLLTSIENGHYDVQRSLIKWVRRIAFNRASDLLRRTIADKVRIAAAAVLLHLRSGRDYRSLDTVEREELGQIIRAAIDKLPGKQRVVFQVFVDHYPASRASLVLQREVSRITGQFETVASVKQALYEGRRKVQLYLRKRGYGPEGIQHDA